MSTNQPTPNHLINEKSPYLLQHAFNPVDWYPWGKEAFEKSKKENKPIFLSIGYSTCHWCHVMAHESFENSDIAEKINEYFISVKVDREERPDLDHIYMTAVTAMTGQGGWPLTVFLTPEQKPFWGGTYFPPYAKWGSAGFMDIIESIHQTWTKNPQSLIDSSQSLTDILNQRVIDQSSGGKLDINIFDQAFNQFKSFYDERFGGFGRQPKFPSSHNLSFLLRYFQKTKNDESYQMVMHSLHRMSQGGIYDHLGGGFHRYSTDETWQIPHFEKMLYDQANLVKTYLEAFQLTQNDDYQKIVREVCDYVLRDMQNPEGGFYSAEDADSIDPYEQDNQSGHQKEGAYYLWTKDDLDQLLGADSSIFNFYYGVRTEGNARVDPLQEFSNRNVLSAEHSIEQVAKDFSKTKQDIEDLLKRCHEKLLKKRVIRLRPHLDDKILTDWNALMISALALSAAILREEKYLQAAMRATDFIVNQLMKDGKLLHRYRDGQAALWGNLDDYAFFIQAIICLYEATFEVRYLELASELTEKMIHLFWDNKRGGFYFTAADNQELIVRSKEVYDGAIPSGNSIAAECLLKMYHITFKQEYLDKASLLFNAFNQDVSVSPSAYAQLLSSFTYLYGPSVEIVLVGSKQDKNFKDFLKIIYHKFLPNKVVLFKDLSNVKECSKLSQLVPMIKDLKAIDEKLTVYVCVNHSCRMPVTSALELVEILNEFNQPLSQGS